MSRPLVIHHANCVDGIVAVWAVVQAHPRNTDVELHAATYGSAPPDVTERDVIIVDFSYPRAVLLEMFSKARSLAVYDHHATAKLDLADLPFCIFDMERSGAGLAWDTFHPAAHRPWLVAYAEDRDLWRFKLPQSREVNAWLQSQPITLEAFDAVADAGLEAAAKAGRAVLVSQRRYIDDTKARARFTRFEADDLGSWRVPVVNAGPYCVSEVVGELAEHATFAAAWHETADGRVAYSLRSRGEGGADVSMIARVFGGGGHRNAAGFTVDTPVHELAGRTAWR